jgi:putative intracellular protease/amidase
MIGKFVGLSLQSEPSIAEGIRRANSVLARGEKVWRWTGPGTPQLQHGDLVFPESSGSDGLSRTHGVEPPGDGSSCHLVRLTAGPVALLWDKSFFWGYLAVMALRDLGFTFDLVSAQGVRGGALSSYQLLVVPGGWASLKSEALGPDGRNELRRFVRQGGSYLGLCGGAGLALRVDEGLGLLPVARKPLTERLPNCSGSIRVRRSGDHALWCGLPDEASFQVWWPSQFEILEPETVQVVGCYHQPGDDFFVSDLNVFETQAAGIDWRLLERDYEINLDPRILLGEPAVLEGRFGAGRVLLSYPHLETPGDAQGNLALFNVWYDLLATAAPAEKGPGVESLPPSFDPASVTLLQRIAEEAEELVTLGAYLELWTWRNSWLLQWRRGVRGAEFGTLCLLLQGLREQAERCLGTGHNAPEISRAVQGVEKVWRSFKTRARALLEAEAQESSAGKSDGSQEFGESVHALRMEIFNCVHCYGSKSYGGLYRPLLDAVDSLLFRSLQAARRASRTTPAAPWPLSR